MVHDRNPSLRSLTSEHALAFSSLFLPLSIYPRAKELDIFAASDAADRIVSVIKNRRENAEEEFRVIVGKVSQICHCLCVYTIIPSSWERGNQAEPESQRTPEDYFRETTYVPYLDSLIKGFDSLFGSPRWRIRLQPEIAAPGKR